MNAYELKVVLDEYSEEELKQMNVYVFFGRYENVEAGDTFKASDFDFENGSLDININ